MNWALALCSAVLLLVIHPAAAIGWLAWVALAPLVFAVAREPRARYRFLLGWTAGVVYWFFHCTWIQFVLEVHGGMGRWGGWGTFLLFSVLKAIHLGVFAWLAGWLTQLRFAPLAIAALWIGIERTHGTFGFAWLALGNAGIDMPGPLHLAPLVGVYGLSFLFAMSGAGVALAAQRRNPRWLVWTLVPLLTLLWPSEPAPQQPVDSATVLQPNLDEEAEWTTDSTEAMQQRLVAESMAGAMKARSRLIIWPESPGPFYFFSDARFRQAAADLARTTQAYFLFGSVAATKTGAPLNSAVMLSPAGDVIDRYDKIYLVPFGEFVPSIFSWVNRITHEAGDFAPGERIVTFPTDRSKPGVFICYESAFPHLVRQFTGAGANLLINLSNDGYFGRSYAREQHLQLVRMRAVENRRWIVRATNDGISATIDPSGQVTERVEPFKERVTQAHFGYSSELTPYVRHGDWFTWGCLVFSLALVLKETLGSRQKS